MVLANNNVSYINMVKKSLIVIFIVTCIVIASMVGVYIKQVKLLTKNSSIDDGQINIESLEQARLIGGLSGSIIMELVDKSGAIAGQWTYALDMAKPLEPIFVRAPEYVNPLSAGFNLGVPDIAVFTSLTNRPDNSGTGSTVVSQIFTIPISDTDSIFPEAAGKPKQITDDEIQFKQMPVLSKDAQKILYMAKSGLGDNVVNAGEWGIYIVDATSTPKKVTSGTYPRWIDNNKFIYIADEGLFLYDIVSGTKKELWGMNESGALSNMRLDLSADSKYIAWSFPDIGKLWVLDVKEWGNESRLPELSLFDEVDVHGFWPVFSPDSRYIAIQAVDWDTLHTNPNPRLQIYALQKENGGVLKKIDWKFNLDAFEQSKMFITDWY